ncbi:MAG TPA: cupin domain-containing protein [Inquilinus sp.]
MKDWRESGARIVRAEAIQAAKAEPSVKGRATAFNFDGFEASGRTWIGSVTLRPGAVTGAHHHGRHEVAVYVAHGRAEIRWGERLDYAATVAPGDFVYFAPHVPHQERNLSGEEILEFVVIRSDNEGIFNPLDVAAIEHPESIG